MPPQNTQPDNTRPPRPSSSWTTAEKEEFCRSESALKALVNSSESKKKKVAAIKKHQALVQRLNYPEENGNHHTQVQPAIPRYEGAPVPAGPEPIDSLHRTTEEWLFEPDDDTVDLTCATIVSHDFDSSPVFLVVIQPPGSSKTTILSAAQALPICRPLGETTPKAILSGYKPDDGDDNPSLIHELKGRVAVYIELGAVLSKNRNLQADFFSLWRQIHDGKIPFDAGSGVTFFWQGRVSLLAGATQAMDGMTVARQKLGDRYLFFRPTSPDPDELLDWLDKHPKAANRTACDTALAQAFQKWRDAIATVPNFADITWKGTIKHQISLMGRFLAVARTGVDRGDGGILKSFPLPEGPARIAHQLHSLAAGLAVARGRFEVNEADAATMRRVVRSTLPPMRDLVIGTLFRSKDPESIRGLSEGTGIPLSTMRRLVEDFDLLKLIDPAVEADGESCDVALTEKWRKLLDGSGLYPAR